MAVDLKDFLAKLTNGGSSIYDYSKSPEENELTSALVPNSDLPSSTPAGFGQVNQQVPNSPMMTQAQRRQLLSFEPENIVADAPPQPANIKPDLPFAYKNKPLPQLPVDAPAQTVATPAPSLSDLLAKVQKGPKTDDELGQAQADRNNVLQQLLFIKAGNTAAQGMMRNKDDGTIVDDAKALNDTKVTDLLARRKAANEVEDQDSKRKNQVTTEFKANLDTTKLQDDMRNTAELNDPKSDISKFFRQIAEQTGHRVPTGASASQLKSILPELNQSADRRLKYEMLQDSKTEAAASKAEKDELKAAVDLNKQFDVSFLKTNTGVGKLIDSRNSMAKLEVIAERFKDNPADANDLEVKELAAGINRVLTNSNALGAFEHFLPHNLRGKLSAGQNFLSSGLVPAEQTAYVSAYLKFLEREKHTNTELLRAALSKDTPMLQAYDKKYNNLGSKTVDGVIRKLQLDKQEEGAGASKVTPEDQEAVDWASKNPTDPRAQQILKMHGVK